MTNLCRVGIRHKTILQCILWISLVQGGIDSYFGFHGINYLCDLLLILVLVHKLLTDPQALKECIRSIVFLPVLAFAVVVLLGWIFHPAPIPMALWGIRNYGRFFLYFALCIAVLSPEDVSEMENFFLLAFPVHMILIAYQYWIEGLNRDYLSGLFGRAAGGNGGLFLYLSILLCILVCRYENKQMKLSQCLCYFVAIFVNAALSELKAFFIIGPLIILWYFILSRQKGRAAILVLSFAISFSLGLQILYCLFPSWKGFLNLTDSIRKQRVYVNQNDIGRTAVFSKLTPIIQDWAGKGAIWFGIGLGNADYSGRFSFLNSQFYEAHSGTHYTWLSLGYLFAENGYLGVAAYTFFFIVLEGMALRRYWKNASYWNMMGTFLPLVSLIVLVYNATLRSNYGYMIFAGLAWFVIQDRSLKGSGAQ